MAVPVLDPSLPAEHAPIVSAELRNQFQAIVDQFDVICQTEPLSLTVSNPPTQAQVEAILNKLNEVINTLKSRPS